MSLNKYFVCEQFHRKPGVIGTAALAGALQVDKRHPKTTSV